MREVVVSTVYDVSQISSTNDKAWKILKAIVDESPEDILFDFKGIVLMTPWSNSYFCTFIQDSRVHLRIYSSGDIKRTVDLMLNMSGFTKSRVENIDINYASAPKVDKHLDGIIKRIQSITDVKADKVIIKLDREYSQLSSDDTVKAIKSVVLDTAKKKRVKNFLLDVGGMFIQANIVEKLADLCNELQETGIKFDVFSIDDDVTGYIKRYQCVRGTKNMTYEDRANAIKSTIPPNTIGLLSRYKRTKGVNVFGQMGDGKAIACKPAIFRGVIVDYGNAYVCMDIYDVDKFCTKLEWSLEHDQDEHPGLIAKRERIPVDEIGFGEMFAGSLYHFNLPLQFSLDAVHNVYRCDGNRVTSENILLPELFKEVVASFNLNVNMDVLNECIVRNRKMLGV